MLVSTDYNELLGISPTSEVSQFIQANPILQPLMLEVPAKVRYYFGPDAKLTFRIITDPEFPENRELFALIKTDFEADEAVSRLERMDTEWWLEKVYDYRHLFGFLLR